MLAPTLARRAALLGVLLVTGGLAGCVTGDGLLGASTSDPVSDVLGLVKLREEGGFEMDVPIDVYFLGFDAATVAAVAAKLEPEAVDHAAGSLDRAFPPDPEATPLGGPSWRAPAQPRAVFRVVDLDEAFESAFFAAAEGWKVADSKTGAYDANAAEKHLADALATLRGAPLDRGAPVFVVMHGGEAMGEHSWRYTYSHGHLEPIRIFGEFLPLTVFDASAVPDPYFYNDDPPTSPIGLVFWTVFGADATKPYDVPLEASGEKTVGILEELVVDAAHYRFLKGPIYPISTKPCHHVTLLLAVHQTALTEQLPDFKRAKEYVDVAGLEGAFENLTGDEVTVDLKTYTLPQDEPVLDALTRQAAAFVTLDALRWYLDENWGKFVTPVDGCEEYLSLLLFADPSGHTRQFGGIGTYDVKRSHRISFSIVTDVSRVQRTVDGPLSAKDPTDAWNIVNLLYSHETGHLFGQHHPQHLSRSSADSPTNHAFESVYSVMSYETGTRTIDFGAVDFATWTRGRVGYTIAEAQELGLEDTPEFQAALDHLALGHWTAAHLALEPLVHEEGHGDDGHDAEDYGFVHSHPHPWG